MLEPGEIVDRFQIVELLGAGGIAEVYKARHRVLGSLHALKVVTAGGPAVARRLLREGIIQAQLRHPNVVAVTDVIEVHGHTALVLEYVEGVTLQGYLIQRGVLALDEALALYAQVLAAVAAAHTAGVLHRDLKPANVLLTPGPTGVLAKVADFGLAKVVVEDAPGTGDTMQGLVMGTPGYMAPEQVGDAATADARADVFALGVILYEILAGIQPFTGTDVTRTLRNTLHGKHRPLREVMPTLPESILDAVDRCLAVERQDRFTDARALARAIYGDRPDLAEVVDGSRPATPLAISLPSIVPLSPAGMGSAAQQPANPTLGPAGLTGAMLASDAGLGDDAAAWSGTPARIGPPRAAPNLAALAAGPSGTAESGAPALGADDTLRSIEAEPLSPSFGSGEGMAAPPPTGPSSADTLGVPALDLGGPADASEAPVRAAPSRRWLLSGFGLFAAAAVIFVLVRPMSGPPPAPEEAGLPAADAAAPENAPPSPGSAPIGGAPPEPAPAAVDAPVGVATPAATRPPAIGAGGAPAASTGAAATAPVSAPADLGAAAPADASADGTEPATTPASEPVDPVETTVVADAAPVAEKTVAAAASAVAAATPARFNGKWEGTWNGRPFTLTLAPEGGTRLGGRLDVLVGSAYRTFRLAGTVDTRGHFVISEATTPGWWIEGELAGEALTGAIRHPDSKKATGYTAKRR